MASRPSVGVRTPQDLPWTTEDLEAERRYRQAVAYRSQSAPTTPINRRDNRSPLAQTWNLEEYLECQIDSSNPPSPPDSSNSGASLQDPDSQQYPELDTEPSHEREPSRRITIVTNMVPCIKCNNAYAPDIVWIILNEAMEHAPGLYTQQDWEDAKGEDRWAQYLRSLTKRRLVKERMGGMCARCILNCVSKAQRWPWYDVERRVWSWSYIQAADILSA
jgi:hypothetical protein